jgi:hypothetical protein
MAATPIVPRSWPGNSNREGRARQRSFPLVGQRRDFPRSRRNCACAPVRVGQGRPQAARIAGRLDRREIGRAMIGAGEEKIAAMKEAYGRAPEGKSASPIAAPRSVQQGSRRRVSIAPPPAAGPGTDCPRRGAHYDAATIVTRRAEPQRRLGCAHSAIERDGRTAGPPKNADREG